MTNHLNQAENMNAAMSDSDIDNVSGGVLALALVPFIVGFVAGRIVAEQLK